VDVVTTAGVTVVEDVSVLSGSVVYVLLVEVTASGVLVVTAVTVACGGTVSDLASAR
jgi:hypothetical protein